MAPPHQGFNPDNGTAQATDLRLVKNLKLSTRQRQAQTIVTHQTLDGKFSHTAWIKEWAGKSPQACGGNTEWNRPALTGSAMFSPYRAAW
jgi:hypothetical protein